MWKKCLQQDFKEWKWEAKYSAEEANPVLKIQFFSEASKCQLVSIYTRFGDRTVSIFWANTRGADKSLARPGRKQVTATEDFDVHISYL
jgi:hypothetical protein